MFCGRGGGWKCFSPNIVWTCGFLLGKAAFLGRLCLLSPLCDCCQAERYLLQCEFLYPFFLVAIILFFRRVCQKMDGKSDWGCVAQLFAKLCADDTILREQSLMAWIELKCRNYYFSRMFYYFYIPLEKSHSVRAKKKKNLLIWTMDSWTLAVIEQITFCVCFCLRMDRFLPFFSSMGKVVDAQCNAGSWNASCISQPSSGSCWVFFCKIDGCISSCVLYLTLKQSSCLSAYHSPLHVHSLQ